MEPEGWSRDSQMTDHSAVRTNLVVAFRKALSSDYSATATFARHTVTWLPRGPLVVDDVTVGVSYEPLRRLWPLWADFGGFDELAEDLGALLAPPRPIVVTARTEDEARDAAARLAPLVIEHAVPFARAHASVLLLEEGHKGIADPEVSDSGGIRCADLGSGDFEREALGVPAVRAASGQLDEAEQALQTYLASRHTYARSNEYLQYTRRLRGWIDASHDAPR